MRYSVLVGKEAKEFRFWTRRDALWAASLGKQCTMSVDGRMVRTTDIVITAWDRWTGRRVS